MKQVNLKIYGQVQGVFYRAEAQKKALSLGIFGFVKNEPDETVTIIAEGEEDKLKELIEWAKIGPELAQVTRVEEFWQKATGNFNDFKVE